MKVPKGGAQGYAYVNKHIWKALRHFRSHLLYLPHMMACTLKSNTWETILLYFSGTLPWLVFDLQGISTLICLLSKLFVLITSSNLENLWYRNIRKTVSWTVCHSYFNNTIAFCIITHIFFLLKHISTCSHPMVTNTLASLKDRIILWQRHVHLFVSGLLYT